MASFYPEGPTCRGCGRIGHTKATCPTCNKNGQQTCVYCKKSGHINLNCPTAPPCQVCNQKGHPSNKCPSRPSLRPLKASTRTRKVSSTTRPGPSVVHTPQNYSESSSSLTSTRSADQTTQHTQVQRFRKWASLNVICVSPAGFDGPAPSQVCSLFSFANTTVSKQYVSSYILVLPSSFQIYSACFSVS